MRFCTPLLGLILLASLPGCGDTGDVRPAKVTLAARQTRPEEITGAATFGHVGVGSCTASGCHGTGSTTTIAGSEYNIWISADPHADAHSVLYDEISLRMLRRLDGKGPEEKVAPYADARCIVCHSTPGAPADHLSDGVGCEACHGPAQRWLSAHYEFRFNGAGPPSNRAAIFKLGFNNTDDLVTRAEICAGCHVGAPGRDVNHDLIAAGHPRLQFDFATYYRRLPVHWDVTEDKQNYGARFDALAWAIGQAINSRAALERLAARAESGQSWPELSEWSCAACHHDLTDDTGRQKRLAQRGGLSGLDVAWDDWHHHLSRNYLGPISRAWNVDPKLADEITREMADLAALAGDLRADRRQLAERSAALAAKMDRWMTALRRAEPDAAAMTSLSREIVAHHRDNPLTSFSETALAYDALASLHQSRIDAGRRSEAAPANRELTAAIGQWYEDLARAGSAPSGAFEPERTAPMLDRLNALLQAEGRGQ